MKSPVPYFGGKLSVASKIVDLLPAHDSYVEPYAGGLSVLLAKPVEPMEVVNDLDGNLVNFWRVLRNRPDELLWAVETTPHSRAEFFDKEASDDLERARRVFVRLTQGRSARLSSTGWRFNATPTTDASLAIPRYLERYRERLLPTAERLRNVTLENSDALDVIHRFGKPGAVLYVDPPYIGETRPNSKATYVHEKAGSHEDLLDVLLATPAAVVLSGYAHASYEAKLGDWERHEIGTRTQSGARTEVVWVKP